MLTEVKKAFSGLTSMKFLKYWILPVFVSIGIFWVFKPAFAQIIERQQSLIDFLKTNNVEIGSEAVDGYTQIYYFFDQQKKFITQGAVNSNIPVTDGEQIVYRKSLARGDQLFIYNILTDQTVQITTSGSNTNPKIKDKNIVWEGLVNGNWQIFYYDGMKVTQLTFGDLSINADIDGDFIIYARRDITGTWRSEIYSISKKEVREITIGTSSKKPKVRNGRIFLNTDGSEKEFTLTAEDMFTLNLLPLTASGSGEVVSQTLDQLQVISTEDIMTELQASTSASIP